MMGRRISRSIGQRLRDVGRLYCRPFLEAMSRIRLSWQRPRSERLCSSEMIWQETTCAGSIGVGNKKACDHGRASGRTGEQKQTEWGRDASRLATTQQRYGYSVQDANMQGLALWFSIGARKHWSEATQRGLLDTMPMGYNRSVIAHGFVVCGMSERPARQGLAAMQMNDLREFCVCSRKARDEEMSYAGGIMEGLLRCIALYGCRSASCRADETHSSASELRTNSRKA
jgi:hypothetical protein